MQKDVILKERLRFRRERLNLTQEDVAEKSGVSARSISDYERGLSLPSIEQLQKLAVSLGVSAGWLLGEDVETANEPGVLHELSISGTDPESIRIAFHAIKAQVNSVVGQIDFYGRQICGVNPNSGEAVARKVIHHSKTPPAMKRAAYKISRREGVHLAPSGKVQGIIHPKEGS